MKTAYVCMSCAERGMLFTAVFSTDIWISLFKFITECDSDGSMNRKARLRMRFMNKLQNNILKFLNH